MIDEDSLAGCVNTYFQEQSRQGVTQSTGHITGSFGNGNVFLQHPFFFEPQQRAHSPNSPHLALRVETFVRCIQGLLVILGCSAVERWKEAGV